MKRILLIILLFFCLTIIPSFAATWVQIDDYSFIDKDSIKTYINDRGEYEYNKKTFWMKSLRNTNNSELEKLYNKIDKEYKTKVNYGLSQIIINYTNNSMVFKSDAMYDDKGNVIMATTFKDFELDYNSIVPNSNGEFWAQLVKKPRILKKLYKMQQSNQ